MVHTFRNILQLCARTFNDRNANQNSYKFSTIFGESNKFQIYQVIIRIAQAVQAPSSGTSEIALTPPIFEASLDTVAVRTVKF